MEKGGVSGGGKCGKKREGKNLENAINSILILKKKMGREGEKKIIFGKERKKRVKTNIRND